MIKRKSIASLILTVVLTVAIILSLLPLLTGCGKVAQFADPITENILLSMNNSDYAGFSRDFDTSMKAELNEGNFSVFLAQVTGVVGNYKQGSKKNSRGKH